LTNIYHENNKPDYHQLKIRTLRNRRAIKIHSSI